jgi:cation:H+ antiporter
MLIQYIGLIALGLAALFLGGEWLVKSAARLARSFGISTLIIGTTIVAWATSAPELMVSFQAAMQGSSDLAVGNVIGSNIANIGLVLGLLGLLFRVGIDRTLTRRELPIMLGTVILLYVLALDGMLSQVDGVIMVIGFVSFSILMVVVANQERALIELEVEDAIHLRGNRPTEVVRFIAGIALLIVGANLTVDGAVGMARLVGVSELLIGLTLVAVGTSLPEIVASLMAGVRKQPELAVGNIVGSNIANVLGILGLTALLRPIPVSAQIVSFELPLTIGISVLVLVFALWRGIHRLEAVSLMAIYAVFIGVSAGR